MTSTPRRRQYAGTPARDESGGRGSNDSSFPTGDRRSREGRAPAPGIFAALLAVEALAAVRAVQFYARSA